MACWNEPIVGIVVTISPSFSLYRIVVFPAASRPTIRILISFLPQRRSNSLENVIPMLAGCWRLRVDGLVWAVASGGQSVCEGQVSATAPQADFNAAGYVYGSNVCIDRRSGRRVPQSYLRNRKLSTDQPSACPYRQRKKRRHKDGHDIEKVEMMEVYSPCRNDRARGCCGWLW